MKGLKLVYLVDEIHGKSAGFKVYIHRKSADLRKENPQVSRKSTVLSELSTGQHQILTITKDHLLRNSPIFFEISSKQKSSMYMFVPRGVKGWAPPITVSIIAQYCCKLAH